MTGNGTIRVASRSVNSTFLPGNENLAKIYPASDEVNRISAVTLTATITLLRNQVKNGAWVSTVRYASSVGCAGIITGGIRSASAGVLNDVRSIISSGVAMSSAPTESAVYSSMVPARGRRGRAFVAAMAIGSSS